MATVDKLDGIATDRESSWRADFGVPWLPLPDDDLFYARFPHVPVGQRPFGLDTYLKYDTSGGRGSRAEWARVSEEILSRFGIRPEDHTTYARQEENARENANSHFGAKQKRSSSDRKSSPPKHDPLMEALGLLEFPTTLAEFKTAARKRIMETHPDRGGSPEAFRSVYAAYQTLALRIFGARV